MLGATTCDAISEKKVLPAAVLLIGIVYVAVALSLYFSLKLLRAQTMLLSAMAKT